MNGFLSFPDCLARPSPLVCSALLLSFYTPRDELLPGHVSCRWNPEPVRCC